MKFLCIPCDEKMETQVEGIMPEEKKNLAMKFKCKKCGHSIAMLTNKFETEFVSKLGVQMGGTAAEATAAPMGVMAGALAGGKEEFCSHDNAVTLDYDIGIEHCPFCGALGHYNGDIDKIEWTLPEYLQKQELN